MFFADCTCVCNASLNTLLDFNSFKSFSKLFHIIAPLYWRDSRSRLLSEVFERKADYFILTTSSEKNFSLIASRKEKSTWNIVKITFSCGNYNIFTFFSCGPRTTFADQGPSKTVAFCRTPSKIFISGTWNFRIIEKNIKAIFRESFSLLREDSGKMFKLMTFRRGPRTTYCTVTLCWTFLFLLLKIIKTTIFPTFKDNLFANTHNVTFSNSWFMVLLRVFKSWWLKNRFVSSANKIIYCNHYHPKGRWIVMDIRRSEASRYISSAVRLLFYLNFFKIKTSLSTNFVYNLVQTFRGFCQVHFLRLCCKFSMKIIFYLPVNTDKPKFVTFLVFVSTSSSFIAKIFVYRKCLKTRRHLVSGRKTVNSQSYSELREPIKTRENCYSLIW